MRWCLSLNIVSAAAQCDALTRRPDDLTAAAWLLLLSVTTRRDARRRLVSTFGNARPLKSSTLIIRIYDFTLAKEYLRVGESELALQCLRQTGRNAARMVRATGDDRANLYWTGVWSGMPSLPRSVHAI